MFGNTIGLYLSSPTHNFTFRINRTFSSIISSVMMSPSTAFSIALIAFGTFSENNKISLSANKALTSNSPDLKYFVTPFMFRASVIVKPLKPSSSFNKS